MTTDSAFRFVALVGLCALLLLGCGGGSSGGPTAVPPGPGQPPASAPSSVELGVLITGPSAAATQVTGEAQITLSGSAAGDPESMSWRNGSASGVITPGALWSAEIPLTFGDNRIVVLAESGAESAFASVFVIRDASLQRISRVWIDPPIATVGEASSHVVTVEIVASPRPTRVFLHEWALDLSADLGPVIELFDDGYEGGDELYQDGLYTGELNLHPTETGGKLFRAHIEHASGDESDSGPALVTISERLTLAQINECLAVQQSAMDAYTTAKDGGADHEAARQAALDLLGQSPLVASVGAAGDGGGLWIVYASGFGAGLLLGEAGTRGGPSSCNYLPPRTGGFGNAFPQDFGSTEVESVRARLGELVCPGWSLDDLQSGSALRKGQIRTMAGKGVMMIASHGDTWYDRGGAVAATDPLFGFYAGLYGFGDFLANWDYQMTANSAQPVVFTGEVATPEEIEAAESFLRRGHIVIGQRPYDPNYYLVLTPSWFAELPYNNTIVYMGSCRSAFNMKLANSFLRNGAFAFIGYTDYMSTSFAQARGESLFDGLLAGLDLQSAWAADGLPQDAGGAVMLVHSAVPMDRLKLPLHEIVNPGFEDGRGGWTMSRDEVSIISELGTIKPPVSNDDCGRNIFMARVDIGDGIGTLSQPVCIPGDSATLTFRWNAVSQQIADDCGRLGIEVIFSVSLGSEQVLLFSTEDMCGDPDMAREVNAGFPADQFGDADGKTFMTGWREHRFVVENRGGQVTPLKFEVLSADNHVPTVLLVDCIELVHNDD